MIRIYIDWNVMSHMKAGGHAEFSKIVRNDEKFFKVYSTSHISDIAASDQGELNRKNVESDLAFIADLTKGCCACNVKNEIAFEDRSPLQMYDERTDLNDIQQIFTPEGIEKILEDLGPEVAALARPYIDAFKNLPVDSVFKEAFENPETAAQMRQFLPDLENNYTMAGVFNALLQMFNRLNENDDYKHLRITLQKGVEINRDRLYDAKDPQGMINKAYQKKGIVLPETPYDDKNAPKWFNELVNEYLRLDMHGYQEDKVEVGKKGRKQTFRNTMEDAFHTAFATTCDFYITKDDRNYKKAEVVYEKLGINSLVMEPQEFVDHYKNWLHFEKEKSSMLIAGLLKRHKYEISEDGKKQIYFGHFFIFDYFNKIYFYNQSEIYLVLSREKPTHARQVFENELSRLIDKLLTLFGEDIDGLGSLRSEEISLAREDRWAGRKWLHNGLNYNLKLVHGHLQLYLTG